MPPKIQRVQLHVLREAGKHAGGVGVAEEELHGRLRNIFGTDDVSFEETLLGMEQEGLVAFDPKGFVSLTPNGTTRLDYYRTEREAKRVKQQEAKKHRQEKAKANLRPTQIHNQIQKQVAEVGHYLGMSWKLEHTLVPRGAVRLDVVWLKNPTRPFTHAFEIQHRGSWKNAIGNLEAVRRRDENCRLFLVVVDDHEIKKINELLGEKQDESIVTLKASQFEYWHKSLSPLRQEMEAAGLI